MQQYSRIPTMAAAGQVSAAAPRAYTPTASSKDSRRRRGSSTSEEEQSRRGVTAPSRNKSRDVAPQERRPSTTSAQSSLPRSTTPSGYHEARPNQPRNEPVPSTSKFGKSPPTDRKHRNVLRRKAPSIEQYRKTSRAQDDTAEEEVPVPPIAAVPTEEPKKPRDGFLGRQTSPAVSNHSRRQQSPNPAMPPRNTPKMATDPQLSSVPKELRGLTPPTNARTLPHTAPAPPPASSPSTMYSDSPGPWSSRNSTPTSISSYSPGIFQPAKVGSRLRQPSPNISGTPIQHRPARNPSPLDNNSTTALPTGNAISISSSPQGAPTDHPPMSAGSDKQPTESQMKIASLARTPPPRKGSAGLQSPVPVPTARPGNDSSSIKHPEDQAPVFAHGGASRSERAAPASKLPTSASQSRPPRPSRKGTGELQLESSPVIHSRIPSSRLPEHTRQGSRGNSARPPNDSVESLQSTSSSRVPRPSPSPNFSSGATRSQPENPNPGNHGPVRRDSPGLRAPDLSDDSKEAIAGEKPKRFGIFSKKSKTVPEVSSSRRGESQTRKGPAAGTGHEGYGKYVQRGRRYSAGSSTGRARSTSTSGSTSQASLTSQAPQGMDDFLRDRLEPIVISGGGSDGYELTRTQSEQSTSNLSAVSTTSSASYGGYLAQSPVSYSQLPGTDAGSRKQEERKRTVLVKRRSVRKPQGSEGDIRSASRLPTSSSRPSVDNPNTSVSSLVQSDTATTQSGSSNTQTEKGTKSKRSEKWPKWSFFQRSHHIHRKEPQSDLRAAAMPEVPVSVNKIPTPRQQPHYAVLDNEQTDTDSLEDILRRIEDSPPTEEEEPLQEHVGLGLQSRHGPSVLLPEPPATLLNYTYENSPLSPKVFFNRSSPPNDACRAKEENAQTSKPRVNRLNSVGRIPKVVHRAEQQQSQPSHSFSRPFSRGETSLPTTVVDNPTVLPQSAYPAGHEFGSAAPDDTANPTAAHYEGPEFFAFERRKDSDVSGSNSSESRVSLAPVTAVIPPPGSKLTGDEVWDEFDDFIDDVSSPQGKIARGERAPPRKSSGKMGPELGRTLQVPNEGEDHDLSVRCPSSCSTATSTPSTIMADDKHSVHLRRSMVASALHSSLTPSDVPSFSEFYREEGKSNRQSQVSKAQEVESSARTQALPPLPGTENASNPSSDRKRNTVLLELAERNRNGALAQANLRSGSLMTSRWLSFGRVLFSPAQNHVQSPDQSRILVIDGLGNDDWSFYCALTYPMATVYSLSVSQSAPRSSNPAAWDPPPNHRTVHHASIKDPFPFPKGFFTVAIIRFPAACSETELRTTISECKRVLRAGAYLELSVMDLDMVNMGSRARKAVRLLKEQMYTTDPTLSLKPTSDNIQRILGKRGFQNLNRCMVVVPVAGSILASSDTSSSTQSVKHGSMPSAAGNSKLMGQQPKQHKKQPSDDAKVSLGELLADSDESSSKDESIAKMVARVGRWWYTRCYESSVLLDGNLDSSMWHDRRLLRECQRRGTGFKLLIAYAQKPSELPRRTASV